MTDPIQEPSRPPAKKPRAKNRKKTMHVPVLAGVTFLQLMMTQVVTFLGSLLFPDVQSIRQFDPDSFVTVLTLTYTLGIFWTGWAAIAMGWLPLEPRSMYRLLGTVAGVYLALIVPLFLYPTLEAGNPFFFIAIFTGLAGFYLSGITRRKRSTRIARRSPPPDAPPLV